FSFMPPEARSTLPSCWRSRSPLRSPIASLARPFALSILSSAMCLLPEVAPATRGSRRRPSKGTRRHRGPDRRPNCVPWQSTTESATMCVDTNARRAIVSDQTPPPPPPPPGGEGQYGQPPYPGGQQPPYPPPQKRGGCGRAMVIALAL